MPKMVLMWGAWDEPAASKKRRYKILPNPWPPDSIDRLIEIAIVTGGLAPVAYKLIALWIEDRKARKIRIKQGEHELELQGGVSGRELERMFNQFRRLTGASEKADVEVTVPHGLDHSIPLEMVREVHQEKASRRRPKSEVRNSAKKASKKKGGKK